VSAFFAKADAFLDSDRVPMFGKTRAVAKAVASGRGVSEVAADVGIESGAAWVGLSGTDAVSAVSWISDTDEST